MPSTVYTGSEIENPTAPMPTDKPPATGQWFTPPIVATHRKPAGMFTVGESASFELKGIAENGTLGPVQDALSADEHVDDSSDRGERNTTGRGIGSTGHYP